MKKIFTILFLMSFVSNIQAQNSIFPVRFESSTDVFVNFGEGIGTIVDNPDKLGINTSSKVGQIIKAESEIWTGSKLAFSSTFDFTNNNSIRLKVFSPRANVPLLLKLQKAGDETTNVERIVRTTVANQWEELIFDFSGATTNLFSEIAFMFDYGTMGDGSDNFTFLIDDVSIENNVLTPLAQIDLPITFEGNLTDFIVSDFSGNTSYLVSDPENQNNSVVKTTKSSNSATWAGTTMGTSIGLANAIPFSESEKLISVNVYSPVSGIPIRLKAEDHTNESIAVEVEVINSLANQWETLVFDFSNQASATPALNLTNSYDKLSIFFDYGSVGKDLTYYWDNIYFGIPTQLNEEIFTEVQVFPNPTSDFIYIRTSNEFQADLFNLSAQKLKTTLVKAMENTKIDISTFGNGIYLLILTSQESRRTFKIIKN